MSTYNNYKGISDDNQPTVIYGNSSNFDDVFSSDWAKIDSKHELYACGCGDGGVRVYSYEGK